MKLLQGMLILLLLGMTIPAHAGDPEAQADLLLAKISAALKNDRMSEALSSCSKLEKLGPSLAKPLPESFYFDYIETLHRSGVKGGVLNRSYAYLQKYGKKAPHYDQVTAIIREQQEEAMRAGNGDADAAVVAWKEEDRLRREKEHEQALQKLRVCQSEAIALEGTEKVLSMASEEMAAQSEALLGKKTALDQRMTRIDRSSQATPEELRQMRAGFNRDSQAYNDAVDAFNRIRETYADRVDAQSSRLQSYQDRCAELLVSKSDLETICGKSDDWFCRVND